MIERARRLVYVAAPLFNVAEREFNARLKLRLMPHLDVFLPQEDGGLVGELVANGASAYEAASAVFAIDVSAIRRSDALLIVMDGRSIDEGAAVELGIAYALGKLCIGLQTDVRRLFMGRNNPMIDCALTAVFSSEEAVVSWLTTGLGVGSPAEPRQVAAASTTQVRPITVLGGSDDRGQAVNARSPIRTS